MSAEHKPRFDALAYSIPDAGRQIGLSKTTIWRMIASGELRSFKAGGRTLISYRALEDWLDRHESAA
jgi:excisionase family DNA binding protein